MKSPSDHSRVLLKKASNDLVAARATLATGQALDVVCFHAQQAVEKSLKAILAFYDVEYPWRHDLGELLGLVRPLAPEIVVHEEHIFRMTPYAVEVRYDEEFEPSLGEASWALQAAEDVYRLSMRHVVGVDQGEGSYGS